ncbi:putative 1-phosphatidylinositol-4,5-bisphosphate phosphodiesterase 1 [Mollisia scopiformis]|uniref:Phosphoinositide phospholipase C n=1 Tax=Mollisia scopiformis TaxID=149040 RepID=A0A194X5C3_MOLSC|nr:putative 1-phosphatidylinositol-4,5-bisphosphate phosphodiesterase 1 [Mollisia scopiformis]KUJ15370.1 putative 1-phosphatidylinositol-4,5-bisphosphate phosphodiesterase 1 [Mollisia scopiformis]
MSPETAQLTTNNSSIQGSPEGLRGRDAEFTLPPFELPESIVSRKSSQSAMSEAMSMSKSPGLIRRLSNRATQFAGRRRQSSTTAMSRDHSTGPVIMRRRSDSTNTAPEGGKGALFSDSDDEIELGNLDSYGGPYGLGIDFPSTTASIGSSTVASSAPAPGPVIPSILLQGTAMTKITKKKKKLLTFVLEREAAKVSWDKNRPSKSLYIDDITEIRVGIDARNYRQEHGISEADETRFFTIIYNVPDKSKSKSQKLMHLIASDDQTFELWTTTLEAISKHRQELMASLSSFHEKAVKAHWRTEMNRRSPESSHLVDEEIEFVGVERLCRSLHIYGSSDYLRTKFEQADVSRSGRLNFVEFQEFVKLMKRREDVRAIYRELTADTEKGITIEEFFRFLVEVQDEDVESNRSHWESVFAKFARKSKPREQTQQEGSDAEIPRMNEAALSSFMISTFNLPLDNAPAEYSLDRPMNEYYISSSHNTYLLGRQVAGQSSVEAYISALNRGCRCVEVDCWNGSGGEPVVMHGRTLTSQVSFADVMSTISKYAFVKSPYPLWVSLEVHCNPQQQAIMAEIIKETCGSKLVTQPIDPTSEQLPSPSELLGRILIKVKKPRMFEDAVVMEQTVGRNRGNSLNSPLVRPLQLDNSTVSAGLLPPSPYVRANRIMTRSQLKYSGSEGQDSLSSSTSDSESLTEDIARAKDSTRRNKTSNIIKVLGELGVYSMGLKFHGFDAPESKTYNHVFSFMENTFDKNSKTQDDKRIITRHNMRYMMRVYPNGWRVASTNFDPLKYWRRSVQMVALNWQTYDLGMQMNDAMFAAGTDQSGYVLKPSEIREIKMLPTVPEEAGDGHVKRERKNVTFSIDVVSAQQLMRPKTLASNRSVDPYVEVEVYHADDKDKENKGVVGEGGLDASGKDGSSGLGTPHRRRTQIVRENGFNPIFDKKFNFTLTTKHPELVFVRWTVRCSTDGNSYNEKGAPLATYTAKLCSLKQGYRTLPLYDNNGDQFLFSTLFCRIKIDPATSIYVNGPEAATTDSVGVLKTIGRTVWNRSPMSPKSSMDSGHQ